MRAWLIIFFSLFLIQADLVAQRLRRKPGLAGPSTPVIKRPDGPVYKGELTNRDSVPVFLKIGPGERLRETDTVILEKKTHCSGPVTGEHYDLYDPDSFSEGGCIAWYSLQCLKPGETVRFYFCLNQSLPGDSSRIYISYTRNTTLTKEQEYSIDKTGAIVLRKDPLDFRDSFIDLNGNKDSLVSGEWRPGSKLIILMSKQTE